MIAAVKGFVSKIEEYRPKDSTETVEMVHIAAGEYMMRVKVPDGMSFEEMDEVVVSGELGVYERRPYIKAGAIRLYTAADALLFRRDLVEAGIAQTAAASSGFGASPAGLASVSASDRVVEEGKKK